MMSKRSQIQNPNYTKKVLKGSADDACWKKWPSVSISFSGFPKPLSTRAVWNAFYKQGNITSIELNDDKHGRPMNKGRVQFTYVSFLFLFVSEPVS